MPVLGLTGPNASGKGEVVRYLRTRGFSAHSLSDVLREILEARGEEPTRERMMRLGTALRAQYGPGVLAERLLARLDARDVVDSIRNPGEVAVLRRLRDFVLVLVDAPVELRFARARRRGRPGDPDTLEAFRTLEAQENSADPAGQQLAATAALADYRIWNAGSLEELHQQVDALLREVERGGRRP